MTQLPVGSSVHSQNDDIDISAFFGRLLQHWLLISAFVAFAVIGAVTYLHLASYEYTAELRVTPVDTGMAGVAGRSGGLSNVASLIGVNLSAGQGVAPFQLYVESLLSRDAARLLVSDESLMRNVFADEWDADAGTWREPASLLYSIKRWVLVALGTPVEPWHPPGEVELHRYLKKNVAVGLDTKTMVGSISMSHENREFAIALISTLDRVVDDELRRRALSRAKSNVEYLSQKLASIVVAEHRQAIATALSEQEKQIMLASSSAPFAADPLGIAAAWDTPTSPRPLFIILIAIALGLTAALMLVLVAFPASTPAANEGSERRTNIS